MDECWHLEVESVIDVPFLVTKVHYDAHPEVAGVDDLMPLRHLYGPRATWTGKDQEAVVLDSLRNRSNDALAIMGCGTGKSLSFVHPLTHHASLGFAAGMTIVVVPCKSLVSRHLSVYKEEIQKKFPELKNYEPPVLDVEFYVLSSSAPSKAAAAHRNRSRPRMSVSSARRDFNLLLTALESACVCPAKLHCNGFRCGDGRKCANRLG